MVITSPGYMQTRSLEVGLALAMFTSGLVFAWPGDTLAAPIFSTLRRWTDPLSEWQLGMVLMVGGAVRWAALAINSYHCSTPLIRAAGCLLGAFLWSAAASGIASSQIQAVPWLLGLVVALGAMETYSAFRTGLDADALDSLGFRRRAHRRRRPRVPPWLRDKAEKPSA